MLDPVVIFVFLLNSLSLVIHLFGIYCLQKQNGGNKNQRILLQNLSAVETLKIVNDYISMTSYYCYPEWYHEHIIYFDIFEIDILTILFSCFILITVERLVCIMFCLHYKSKVTVSLIKDTILATWFIGLTPGLFFWAISNHYSSKVYYYLFFDVLVILLTIFTYLGILKSYHRTRGSISGRSSRRSNDAQLVRIPFIIVTTFVLCNAIPDVIFAAMESEETYRLMILMWGFGFLMDPCVYIFMNKKTRSTAESVLKRWRKNFGSERGSFQRTSITLSVQTYL